jgi:hypothetical protein
MIDNAPISYKDETSIYPLMEINLRITCNKAVGPIRFLNLHLLPITRKGRNQMQEQKSHARAETHRP